MSSYIRNQRVHHPLQLVAVIFLVIQDRVHGHYSILHRIHFHNRVLAFQRGGTVFSLPSNPHHTRRFRLRHISSIDIAVLMSNPSQSSSSFSDADSVAAATAVSASSSNNEDVTAAIEFANLVGQLKITPRTGWIRRNIVPCESVADHSWRVAVLAFLLQRSSSTTTSTTPSTQLDFDFGKVVQIALIHDVAECIVGDITPEDNVSKDDKHQMEYNAMRQITKLLHSATAVSTSGNDPDSVTAASSAVLPPSLQVEDTLLMKLFHEYEERQSIESIIVKDLDLLDMILQANTYEQQHPMTDLSDFFVGTPSSRFQIPQIRRIAEQIHYQRNDRIGMALPKNNRSNDNNHTTATKRSSSSEIKYQNSTPQSVDSINDDNVPFNDTELLLSSLSKSDLTFVTEFTKTLPPSPVDGSTRDHAVAAAVLALRQWDAKHEST
jgi:putative hydrolases of HD superfamily